MEKLLRFFKEEEGTELVEWAVMVALLVTGVILVVTALGGRVSTLFQDLVTALT